MGRRAGEERDVGLVPPAVHQCQPLIVVQTSFMRMLFSCRREEVRRAGHQMPSWTTISASARSLPGQPVALRLGRACGYLRLRHDTMEGTQSAVLI